MNTSDCHLKEFLLIGLETEPSNGEGVTNSSQRHNIPQHIISTKMAIAGRGRIFVPGCGPRLFSILKMVLDSSRSNRVAVIDPTGKSFTYGDLNRASSILATNILNSAGFKPSIIAGYHSPGALYVISSLATWKLGATFVPLSPSHTDKELAYFVTDSGAELVLSSVSLVTKLVEISVQKISLGNDIWQQSCLDPNANTTTTSPDSAALIIYTSGTTGQPKGVVHSQRGLYHMIKALTTSWEYTEADKILHFLPLHHLHGILNKLWCVLYAGGIVEFLKSGNALEIWRRLSDTSRPLTLFMAVPTIYAKMLEAYSRNDLPDEVTASALNHMRSFRVMVSGSASLPIPILRKWKALCGHHLLERYGMTEVGMALSNPLHGERIEGFVGYPLPLIECKIVPDTEFQLDQGDCGELLLKARSSPSVFLTLFRDQRSSKSTTIAPLKLKWHLIKMVGSKLATSPFANSLTAKFSTESLGGTPQTSSR
jgi:malonyl-CoA/methylmalonyl-CoA synthetase